MTDLYTLYISSLDNTITTSSLTRNIPLSSTLSTMIDQHFLKQGNQNSIHDVPQHALSPFACLIVAHEIIKSRMTTPSTSSSSSNFQSASSALSGATSNKNASVASTHNLIEVSDYPLRNHLNDMDKCANILGKLVNPASQPVVTKESTNPPKKPEKNGNNNNKKSVSKSSLKRKRDGMPSSFKRT